MVGMKTPNAGHVQVKYNGTWGTICPRRGRFLTYQSAEVICRQLRQGPPVKHGFSHNECTATNQGAETVWLSDLNCQGFEDSVDQCPHRGWGRLDPEYCRRCTPKYCSVCLICQPRQDANITGTASEIVIEALSYRAEQFSDECRKTQTKVITPANHKLKDTDNPAVEPIKA